MPDAATPVLGALFAVSIVCCLVCALLLYGVTKEYPGAVSRILRKAWASCGSAARVAAAPSAARSSPDDGAANAQQIVVSPGAARASKQAVPARLATGGQLDEAVVYDWEIDARKLKMKYLVGKGNFGEVWLAAIWGSPVAVKTMLPELQSKDKLVRRFIDEIMLMSTLHHPNVVLFLGASIRKPNLFLVLEYCVHGSLHHFLKNEAEHGVRVTMSLIYRFALDIARGVYYLHRRANVLQRDLKARNVLVDESLNAKVADFGLSRIMAEAGEDNKLTACGTPAWTAPEIVKMERYTEKVDVYSFGIILWELITRQEPYGGQKGVQIAYAAAEQGLRPKVPAYCPPEYAELMQECWAARPDDRPSFEEILKRLFQLKKAADTAAAAALAQPAVSATPTPVASAGAGASRPPSATPTASGPALAAAGAAAAGEPTDAGRRGSAGASGALVGGAAAMPAAAAAVGVGGESGGGGASAAGAGGAADRRPGAAPQQTGTQQQASSQQPGPAGGASRGASSRGQSRPGVGGGAAGGYAASAVGGGGAAAGIGPGVAVAIVVSTESNDMDETVSTAATGALHTASSRPQGLVAGAGAAAGGGPGGDEPAAAAAAAAAPYSRTTSAAATVASAATGGGGAGGGGGSGGRRGSGTTTGINTAAGDAYAVRVSAQVSTVDAGGYTAPAITATTMATQAAAALPLPSRAAHTSRSEAAGGSSESDDGGGGSGGGSVVDFGKLSAAAAAAASAAAAAEMGGPASRSSSAAASGVVHHQAPAAPAGASRPGAGAPAGAAAGAAVSAGARGAGAYEAIYGGAAGPRVSPSGASAAFTAPAGASERVLTMHSSASSPELHAPAATAGRAATSAGGGAALGGGGAGDGPASAALSGGAIIDHFTPLPEAGPSRRSSDRVTGGGAGAAAAGGGGGTSVRGSLAPPLSTGGFSSPAASAAGGGLGSSGTSIGGGGAVSASAVAVSGLAASRAGGGGVGAGASAAGGAAAPKLVHKASMRADVQRAVDLGLVNLQAGARKNALGQWDGDVSEHGT